MTKPLNAQTDVHFGFVTYRIGDEPPRAGLLQNGRVHDIAGVLQDVNLATMRAVLDRWDEVAGRLRTLAPSEGGTSLEDCRLCAPVPNPGAVYCAGANYRDHVVNMARKLNIEPEPDPHEAGLSPWHFIKSSWCVVGPDAQVELDSNFLDWEAELAVVIGRTARRLRVDEVADHIAGYMIGNDLSARDRIIRPGIPLASPFRFDWIGQKNFDGACPLGPVLVPKDKVADAQNLQICTWVNGVQKQNSSTSEMIFNIAEQISHLSRRLTLHPGDIILTGTPAGTGAETSEHLERGDKIEISIESLGTLVTSIF